MALSVLCKVVTVLKKGQCFRHDHVDVSNATILHWLYDALWSKMKKKHRQNSHPIIHCPTSEGVSEVSERANE